VVLLLSPGRSVAAAAPGAVCVPVISRRVSRVAAVPARLRPPGIISISMMALRRDVPARVPVLLDG